MNKKQDKVTMEIIEELGLEKLSKKRQDEILAKIGELILKKIFVEVVGKLDENSKMEFEKILAEEKTANEIMEFLSTKIKNYDKIVEGIVVELKKDLKGNL